MSCTCACYVRFSLSNRISCKSFAVGSSYGWTLGLNFVRGDVSTVRISISVVGPVSWLKARFVQRRCILYWLGLKEMFHAVVRTNTRDFIDGSECLFFAFKPCTFFDTRFRFCEFLPDFESLIGKKNFLLNSSLFDLNIFSFLLVSSKTNRFA
mgnify:CR=1 FL=1